MDGGNIPVDQQEEIRLEAVRNTHLLDTPTETEFDELVALAAEICRTPMGMFTLIDRERQWFKASVGAAYRETPRELSFCAHTIQQKDMFIVEDARRDSRFQANPFVTGDPYIRFYAGIPLPGPNGAMLGTLCVLDTVPRSLTDSQRNALQVLAAQVKVRMELRRERHRLAEALRAQEKTVNKLVASENRFRTFMNHAPFVNFIKDADGRFLFYNDRMAERFNVTSRQWLGKTDFDLWPDAAAELRRHDLEAIHGNRMVEHIEETSGPGRQRTIWKSYKFPWFNEQGEVMLGGFAIDLTEEMARQTALEEANLQLQKLATVDPLTGLSNRRVLDERVEFEYRFALRHKTPFSVVLLDLDNFKSINDLHGHAAGDDVLRHVGRALSTTMRTTDLTARYGGEEFVILLPGADPDGAILFCERVRNALRAVNSTGLTVTASFGIAAMDASTMNGRHLVQRADLAMYEAKRGGKDRIFCHREVLSRAMADIAGAPERNPLPPR